jgi:hypothetical protein
MNELKNSITVKNCSSCWDQKITEIHLSTAPCGCRFCFDCIVLMSKLNLYCPLCYEDITNKTKGEPKPSVDSDDSDDENARVASAEVQLPGKIMHQNLNTGVCTDHYTGREVYLTRSEKQRLRLSKVQKSDRIVYEIPN